MRDKKVPASLENMQPYELDLIALSQGVSYKGEIEDRFKQVSEQLMQLTQPLLIVENFHRVEDKQSTLNGILPGLKKLLSKNQLQVVITSTIDGYTKDIEKDKELTAFFEKITEPYLGLFRKRIPPIGGTVDVTPIIALVVLQLLVSFLARIF